MATLQSRVKSVIDSLTTNNVSAANCIFVAEAVILESPSDVYPDHGTENRKKRFNELTSDEKCMIFLQVVRSYIRKFVLVHTERTMRNNLAAEQKAIDDQITAAINNIVV